MRHVDRTNDVDFGSSDDELLEIRKCVCGRQYPYWEFVIGIYEWEASVCASCGRKLFFKATIRVYEIQQEPPNAT